MNWSTTRRSSASSGAHDTSSASASLAAAMPDSTSSRAPAEALDALKLTDHGLEGGDAVPQAGRILVAQAPGEVGELSPQARQRASAQQQCQLVPGRPVQRPCRPLGASSPADGAEQARRGRDDELLSAAA